MIIFYPSKNNNLPAGGIKNEKEEIDTRKQ